MVQLLMNGIIVEKIYETIKNKIHKWYFFYFNIKHTFEIVSKDWTYVWHWVKKNTFLTQDQLCFVNRSIETFFFVMNKMFWIFIHIQISPYLLNEGRPSSFKI